MSNALLRVLTALVGAPLVIGVLYLGGWPFAVLVGAAALVGQWEMYGLMMAGGLKPDRMLGISLGALVAVRAMVPGAFPLAVLLLVLLLAVQLLRNAEGRLLDNLAATLFGVLYPTLLLTFLIDLRQGRGALVDDQAAFWLTLTVFFLIWATDTFAYYVGKSIGKHPLAPTVSPKKTWEGTVGGAVGAVLIAIAFKLTVLDFIGWPHLIALALIGGVLSQLGDLVESKMKRAVGVKDSGTLLPGHGGVLDRFDAFILAAPLFFLYLKYVARLMG